MSCRKCKLQKQKNKINIYLFHLNICKSVFLSNFLETATRSARSVPYQISSKAVRQAGSVEAATLFSCRLRALKLS